MSLDSRRRVRVTGRYVPPAEGKAGGPCIIHTPPSVSIPPDSPTVISIGPRPHRRPDQVDEPRSREPPIQGGEDVEDWSREAAPQPRVSYCETGVPRHTMEELKSILKDSPLVSIQRRVDGKPGSPYTYLQGGSSSASGRPERPERLMDDGKAGRMFSTFKPQSDASRRGPDCRENVSIQPHPTVDTSSPFRVDANTNKPHGYRTHTQASGGSWGETGGSSAG